jgi:polysaccharide biosynthesis protein PslH
VIESARPDVLYIVHRVPYPPDKGDRIRAFHVLRHLSRRANVHLACLADEPIDEHVHPALAQYTRRVAIVPIGRWQRKLRMVGSLLRGCTASEGAFSAPALRALLSRWCSETRYEAVLVSASSLIPYLRQPELADIPAIVDLVDVDSQKWLDYADAGCGPKSWLYRLEGRRLRQLEQGLPAWAHAVTLVSEQEAALYRQFSAAGPVHAIVNGVDLEYFQPQPCATSPTCVFVGALDYRPNVDGAVWFCTEVWPAIHHRRPDATLSLVGRNPTPAVRRLAAIPGVEVIGQVPDVRPYIAAAAVVVVPLQIARGVQNKVLEALAMSRAVVASPPSLEGLGTQPGVHLEAAQTPTEWLESVLHLLANPAVRRTLGAAGRRYVEDHHHWQHCLAPFDELLRLAPQPTRDLFDSQVAPVARRTLV